MSRALQIEFLLAGFDDSSGDPLNGGKVFSYEAGTTTPKALYTNQSGTTPATNPVILDSNGVANVYGSGAYKFVIKTSADVTLYTFDNVQYVYPDNLAIFCGTSSGSSNAYVLSPSPALTALTDGMVLSFIANFSNTGAATANPSSLGAKSIVLTDGTTALAAGDIVSGGLYQLQYISGSNHFRLLNPASFASITSVQRNSLAFGGTTGGTANAATATLSPAPTAYVTGMALWVIAGNTNTSALTINLNSLGAKSVYRHSGFDLQGGDFLTGNAYVMVYNGTQFVLLNPSNGMYNNNEPLRWLNAAGSIQVDVLNNDASNNVNLLATTGALTLRSTGSSIVMGVGGTDYVQLVANSLEPTNTGVGTLGSASKEWDAFYGANNTWSPTITLSAGTVSAQATNQADYFLCGPWIMFQFQATFTINTTAPAIIQIPHPVAGTAHNAACAFACAAEEGGGGSVTSPRWRYDGTNIIVFRPAAATFAVGANAAVHICGKYRR